MAITVDADGKKFTLSVKEFGAMVAQLVEEYVTSDGEDIPTGGSIIGWTDANTDVISLVTGHKLTSKLGEFFQTYGVEVK